MCPGQRCRGGVLFGEKTALGEDVEQDEAGQDEDGREAGSGEDGGEGAGGRELSNNCGGQRVRRMRGSGLVDRTDRRMREKRYLAETAVFPLRTGGERLRCGRGTDCDLITTRN